VKPGAAEQRVALDLLAQRREVHRNLSSGPLPLSMPGERWIGG
jgi:hypothetical protein